MQEEHSRVVDERKSAKEKDKPKHSGVLDKLRGVKHLDILIALVVLVVVLVLYFGVFSGEKKQDIVVSNDVNKEFLSSLESIISSIDGVGRTKIMINYDDNKSIEIAHREECTHRVDKDGSTTVIEEHREPIIIKGNKGDTPIVLSESNGSMKGVIVVASGAGDVKVRLALIDALSTFLRVDSDKIKVYTMKKY